MPIDASPSGTLDIENATLRSRNIASLTNMVAGNDVIRGSAAPTLEVYGDPSNDGGVLPTLEIVSNVEAAGSAFTRLTSNAGVFSIQSGTAGTADSKADITFASIGGNTEHMRIKGSSGNVGIGTDAPGEKLQIVGDSISMTGAATSDNYGQLSLSSASNYTGGSKPTQLKIGIDHTVGSFGTGFIQGIVDNTHSGINLSLCPILGNVGIGLTNPSYRLHTNGSLNFNSPWQSDSSFSVANSTSGSYTSPAIPTNTVTNYTGYKVQIRFDPSPGNPPYAACAYVDWFPIGTNSVGPQYNEHQLLTTAHAPNGLDHTMYVSGTMGTGVTVSGLRVRTVSNYYAGTFTTRWYTVGTNT